MMLIGINHVQITIPEGQEQAAREFYCDLLGLKEIEKPDYSQRVAEVIK